MKQLELQQAFGNWDRTGDAMKKAISDWFALYYNSTSDKDTDPCQRIAYTVVQKLVRAVFCEYVPNCDDPFYRDVLTSLGQVGQAAVQLALVGGESYLKPIPVPGGFAFTVIPRNHVLVFGRDERGELTDVGTVEKSVDGRYWYSLLERRYLDSNGLLTIENRLYRSADSEKLGNPVALSTCPLYADLPIRYTYPVPMNGVGLVRVKTPMLNCVDGSCEGVSVYAAAAGLIRRINENEAQLCREFENGQSRILVSADLLDENKAFSQHLFVGLDEDPETVGIHVFSPQLREQSYLARKQEYLRNVESVIGLQRGMLSDVNLQNRTATEISASGGEYNLTVMDFQRMWEGVLGKTLTLCGTLAKFYGMTAGPVPAVSVDWGNGVLFDEDVTWQDYKDMAVRGLIAPEVALGWRFGMAADTAQQRAAIREKFLPAQ